MRVLVAIALVVVASSALAVPLRVGTYNVRGLPAIGVIPDRSAQMAAIAPLLEDLHSDGVPTVVALEEVFNPPYYDTLTDASTVHFDLVSPKTSNTRPPSTLPAGDGLTLLSDASLVLGQAIAHTTWNDCEGTVDLMTGVATNAGDCVAPKGFLFARLSVGSGMEVDVYTLHADAGQDSGSIAARMSNLNQLLVAIAANSAGRAVIVMGDTNSLYTKSGDIIAAFAASLGLKDAWVETALAGIFPAHPASNLPNNNSACPPPIGSASGSGVNGANCELVDKIFFRSGTNVQLTLQGYDVPTSFVDGSSAPLSDHLPATALFDVELVPEPALAALLAAGSLALAARRRRAC
jgi:hypothetical protein